jgi:competence protein ComEC
MNAFKEPTVRTIVGAVFVLVACMNSSFSAEATHVVLFGCLTCAWGLRSRGLRHAGWLGACLGALIWLGASEAPEFVTDLGEARHVRPVVVELVSMRATQSGAIGDGRLLTLSGQDVESRGARILSKRLYPPGTIWHGKAVIERTSAARNLAATDPRRLADLRGAGLVIRLVDEVHVEKPPWWRWPQVVVWSRRGAIESDLLAGLNDPWRGLAIALATGNKSWLDEDLGQEFVDTGTSHVLAISGLHFGIVAVMAWWLSGLVIRRFTWVLLKWGENPARALAMISVSTVYLLFVGAPASACRAWVVVAAAGLGHCTFRRGCSLHALMIGVAVALCMDPMQVCDMGFQLSFSATLGILLFIRNQPFFLRPPIFGEETRLRRIFRHLGAFVGVSWSANIATAPVLLWHTGALPISSLLLNLIVVPLVSLVVFPVFVMGLVLSQFWSAPGMWLAGASLNLLVEVGPVMARFAHADWNLWIPGTPPGWVVWSVTASAGLVVTGASSHRWLAGLPFLIPLVVWQAQDRPTRVTFLDVGQGDSTLLEVDGTVVLVDAGGRSRGPDIGRTRVIPQLRRAGIARVDYLIVTHPDIDHSGGVPFVLRHTDVAATVVNVLDAKELDRLNLPGVQWMPIGNEVYVTPMIRVLAPPLAKRNDRSLIVEVRDPLGSVLLTGDIEEAAERWWLAQPGSKRFDVVKVPHHGSRTSSTPEFVAATQPLVAAISAGRNNHFHHPVASVVRRWQNASEAVSTHERGEFRVEFVAAGLRMQTSRGP